MTEHHLLNGPLPAGDSGELLTEWRQAVREEIAAFEVCNDAAPPDEGLHAKCEAARERRRAIADKVWAQPSVGLPWHGLRLRAEIVRHMLWPDFHGDGSRTFEDLLAGKEVRCLEVETADQRAVAELVRAMLWTAEAGPAQPAPRPEPVHDGAPPVAWGDVEHLVERAKAGLLALRTLWNSNAALPAEAQREEAVFCFGASMEFTMDAIESLLDDIAETVVPESCEALEAWAQRAQPQPGQPVFRAVNNRHQIGAERLTAHSVSRIVKKAMRDLARKRGKSMAEAKDMVRRFSGHSLRAGYATSAAAADVPALRIQQHTRHKSADMVARYVRESDKWSKSGLKGILHRADRPSTAATEATT